jgi:primosomal protein N' (replication factor Y)
MDNRYCLVVVNTPFENGLLPYYHQEDLKVGQVVTVPLGKRLQNGIVYKLDYVVDDLLIDKIKPIDSVADTSFRVSEMELTLFSWLAEYYHYPLGQLVWDSLPTIMKKEKKLNLIKPLGLAIDFKLTSEQSSVCSDLLHKLENGFSRQYLHGVTGSGKTIIYLHLMQKIFALNRGVHFLIPEINLTPQFIQIFSKYINVPIYTYHSSITDGEKFTVYQALSRIQGPYLLMGVRSSVFLPSSNLGLIIVDEEHDTSFKQVDRCPYNARDVAIKKAQSLNIPVVLGSATPTVENFYHFNQSSNDYYRLDQRVTGNFPTIETIDMRGQLEESLTWPIHPDVLSKISEAVESGEQVLVFVNRLGYAQVLQCRACGHQFQNDNCGCGLNLRFFKTRNSLECAHCDYKQSKPDSCPSCGNINLLQKGFGTEKVEQTLTRLLMQARIERFDRDEIKNFKQLSERLDAFNRHDIDILVGTQMLSKGHNFERVNLVVMLGVDSQLSFADFRANERAYQLITQVAGRSGRYSQHSKVLIQTMLPDHPVFNYLKQNNFDGFYHEELEHRKHSSTPPFSRQVMINFSSKNRTKLISDITFQADRLKVVILQHFKSIELFGPIPSVIEKRAEQFTWFILLKGIDSNELHRLVSSFQNNYQPVSGISVKIDIDPYFTS